MEHLVWKEPACAQALRTPLLLKQGGSARCFGLSFKAAATYGRSRLPQGLLPFLPAGRSDTGTALTAARRAPAAAGCWLTAWAGSALLWTPCSGTGRGGASHTQRWAGAVEDGGKGEGESAQAGDEPEGESLAKELATLVESTGRRPQGCQPCLGLRTHQHARRCQQLQPPPSSQDPVADFATADVSTLAKAQAALRGLAARLRAASPQHAGLHDALLLRGAVQHWVAAVDVAPFAARLASVSRLRGWGAAGAGELGGQRGEQARSCCRHLLGAPFACLALTVRHVLTPTLHASPSHINVPFPSRTPASGAGRGGRQVPLAAPVGHAVLLVARWAQHPRPRGGGEGGAWGPCPLHWGYVEGGQGAALWGGLPRGAQPPQPVNSPRPAAPNLAVGHGAPWLPQPARPRGLLRAGEQAQPASAPCALFRTTRCPHALLPTPLRLLPSGPAGASLPPPRRPLRRPIT